jgi:predicted RecB family nuclease
MNTPISSAAVVAYSHCPRKAYLLLHANPEGNENEHEYVTILNQLRREHRANYLTSLQTSDTDAPVTVANIADYDAEQLTSTVLASGDLVAVADVLTRVHTRSVAEPIHYEPTLVGGSYSVTPELRTELAFVGFVLGQLQDQWPKTGRIVTLDHNTHRLGLTAGGQVREFLYFARLADAYRSISLSGVLLEFLLFCRFCWV